VDRKKLVDGGQSPNLHIVPDKGARQNGLQFAAEIPEIASDGG
jgi:hypothetical protein